MVRLSTTCLAALALALRNGAAAAESWSASEDGFDLGMKTLVIGSGRDTNIPELVLDGYRYAELSVHLDLRAGFLAFLHFAVGKSFDRICQL